MANLLSLLSLFYIGVSSACFFVALLSIIFKEDYSSLLSRLALAVALLGCVTLYQTFMELFIWKFSDALYYTAGKPVKMGAVYYYYLMISGVLTGASFLFFFPSLRGSALTALIVSGLILLSIIVGYFMPITSEEVDLHTGEGYEKKVREMYEEYSVERIEGEINIMCQHISLQSRERVSDGEVRISVDGESSGIPGRFADWIQLYDTEEKHSFLLHEYFVALFHAVKRERDREISEVILHFKDGVLTFDYQ